MRGKSMGAGVLLGIGIGACVAVASVALTKIGSGPSAAPAPPVEAQPPPHPSGASADDVELLRWLQTTGAALNEAVSAACGAAGGLDSCGDLNGAGPVDPNQVAPCIARMLPACERVLATFDATDVPAPFRRAFAAPRARAEHAVCLAHARLELLAAHPDVVRRLRPASRGLPPSMAERLRGRVEDLEVWAADHEHVPAALEFWEATLACARAYDEADGNWGEATSWLRARFYCPPDGCCTVDRVAEMHREGREPSGPELMCTGRR